MSLLSTFLVSHLVPALETSLVAHAPDAQAAILAEIEAFSSEVSSWLVNKMAAANQAPVIPPQA